MWVRRSHRGPMEDVLRLADAARYGLTRERLRSSCWSRPSYGLYARRGTTDDPVGLCRALQLVLPAGAVFSHLTAARLLDLWIPRVPAWLPVQATLPPGATRPDRPGLWVARSRARLSPPIEVQELHLPPVPVVLGQLAEDMSLLDLVIVIDCALHRELCTSADIRAAIRPRQRGAPRVCLALELCDGRSESPWETVLRLLHVVTGFEVEPQFEVYDAAGVFVGRADLHLRGTRRLPEYDGAIHRDRERHRDDLRRDKALARAGFERYGYTKAEIVPDPRLVIRDAEEAYGLPPDPGRLREWWPLYEESTLSSSGWNRWLHRLHRFDHRVAKLEHDAPQALRRLVADG